MARTHVAFLRGINLGGRRVKMAELRRRVAELDVERVDTFLASGNVIFEHPVPDRAALEAELDRHLEETLGFRTEALVRPLSDLRRLAGMEEWEEARGEGFTPHVIFVRGEVDAGVEEALRALETPDDRFRLLDGEAVWLRRGGVSDSAIEPRHLKKSLGGMVHTMRTLNTVQRIVAKYGG